MSKRRGRRTKRKFPVWLIVILVIIIVIVAAVTIFIQKRNAPTTETVDLNQYYKLAAYSYTNDDGETIERSAAGEDETAIVLDNSILEDRGLIRDGAAYIKYSFVKRNIDSRFYYDAVNDYIMVTNAEQILRADIGSNEYTLDGEAASLAQPLALWNGESLYLSIEFVDMFSGSKLAYYQNPARVYIQTPVGTIKRAEISEATEIREGGGNKSKIVAKAEAGDGVKILDEIEGWTKVMDDQGYSGYVKADTLTNIHDETIKSDYEEPAYTHLNLGQPVNMLWHGVFYYGQDLEIYNLGMNVTGINVISPRWYNINTSETYVEIFSNAEYINYAHEKGWKVWAMVTDDLLETENIQAILMDTNIRQFLIQNIMNDVLMEGVDGLNVDLEKVTDDFGDDFIEFIRELSIECRKAGVVLSVDNYTPYEYNAAFHVDQQSQCCDYVTIMAYDHYVGTEEIGPNSSVDFLKEVMEVTLPQVDESRLIIGLPFYSRYWINRGGTDLKNEIYSMGDAKQFLEDNQAETKWDDETGMYTARFEVDGAQIYAWLEDADSIDAKLDFLKSYGIAGVAWWSLGQQTDDVWEVISKHF